MSYPPTGPPPPLLPTGAGGQPMVPPPMAGYPPAMHNPYAYAMGMNMMNPLLNFPQLNIRPATGQSSSSSSSSALSSSSSSNSKPINFNSNLNSNSSPNMNPQNPNSERDRPPVTTVFVGNISEKAPDNMIRSMLNKCGQILNWKRVQGTNGKLQAFGFCEYDNPEATLRCIRLLNNYEIADKKLLVKVDQKTKELLGEYIKKTRLADKTPLSKNAKKAAMMSRYPEEDDPAASAASSGPAVINLELVDENTLKEDRFVINAFESILAQFSRELLGLRDERSEDDEDDEGSRDSVAASPAAAAPGEENGDGKPPAEVTGGEQSENGDSSSSPFPGGGGDDSFRTGSEEIHMKSHLRLDQIEVDEEKKEYITSEIAIFREKHKGEDSKFKQEEIERMNRVERERQERRDRERERNRERDKERQAARERSRERERERDRARGPPAAPVPDSKSKRSPPGRHSTSDSAGRNGRGGRGSHSRSRSPRSLDRRNGAGADHRYKGAPAPVESRSSPAQPPMNPQEDPEEYRERVRLERRLREKEQAYSERLRAWEDREEKRRAEYELEKKEERVRKLAMSREAKKLRQFMEDYEDEKDDAVYYKGSSLDKKLKMREKEIESDNRDRRREKDELDELKKKLLEKRPTTDGGGASDDLDQEVKKMLEEENQKLKSKFDKLDESSSSSSEDEEAADEPPPATKKHEPAEDASKMELAEEPQVQQNGQQPVSQADSNGVSTSQMDADSNAEWPATKIHDDSSNSSLVNSNSPSSLPQPPSASTAELKNSSTNYNDSLSSPGSNSPSFGGFNLTSAHPAGIKTIKTTMTFKKSIQPINQAFAADDDEDAGASTNKRSKLTTQIPSSSEVEERKRAVKKLVESIPTGKDELFAFSIDWEQLDTALMEKRIKPWLNKKIVEYIGEEDATLRDFFCTKIEQRTTPDKFLEETKVILDEEAEMFVIKMWRLLIYETESKRCGLSK